MLSIILSILGAGVVSCGAVYMFKPGLLFVVYMA